MSPTKDRSSPSKSVIYDHNPLLNSPATPTFLSAQKATPNGSRHTPAMLTTKDMYSVKNSPNLKKAKKFDSDSKKVPNKPANSNDKALN
eukprot:CAMPEP_0114580060 /NCGR_PEP_ID=MMETSP0125-20121206/4392_1 /TAXON_ID=485358 ORGANISM="Aristerostoma sp., Strain ATCC 50986" /NCGR_SAMPLE_ID=MMETSP0125 /ASSEMBLY_ACC=CAM_ASM_000245 /LENGTH=88 /DNA_ID=CAMNT_0001771337 /DNA_START=1264 /DNA_END=1530 /DNA_ORIENTATION=-